MSDFGLPSFIYVQTNFLALNRDFGRFGKLSYLKETKDYEGTTAQLPDSEKEYMKRLNKDLDNLLGK